MTNGCDDPALLVERAMGQADRDAFLEAVCAQNPGWRGAHVADLLTEMASRDHELPAVEAACEALAGDPECVRRCVPAAARVQAVLDRARGEAPLDPAVGIRALAMRAAGRGWRMKPTMVTAEFVRAATRRLLEHCRRGGEDDVLDYSGTAARVVADALARGDTYPDGVRLVICGWPHVKWRYRIDAEGFAFILYANGAPAESVGRLRALADVMHDDGFPIEVEE